MLATPPDQWHLRGDADRKNPAHGYRGERFDYSALLRWSRAVVDTRNALVGKRSPKIIRL